MQNKQTIVEVAYKYLCKKKKSTFMEMWNHVKKQCNILPENEEKAAGDLYTGIILDTNFFLKNDKIWYPRSEVSLEEIKYQMTTIEKEVYSVNDNSEVTDELLETKKIIKIKDEDIDDEDIDDEDIESEEDDTLSISIKPVEDDYDE